MSKPFVAREIVKFLINGLAATVVHFSVLTALLDAAHLGSAGLANGIAALFGITVSFFGNRYFVFRGHSNPIISHAWRFGLLYGAMACLHAAVLFVWTDRMHLDYRLGFLLAAAIQVCISYFGNKLLVFI